MDPGCKGWPPKLHAGAPSVLVLVGLAAVRDRPVGHLDPRADSDSVLETGVLETGVLQATPSRRRTPSEAVKVDGKPGAVDWPWADYLYL